MTDAGCPGDQGQDRLTGDAAATAGSTAGSTAGATAGLIIPAAEAEPADELVAGAIDRGFDGDAELLRTFVSQLEPALPQGTLLVLRGSAVVGRSFRTGEPFDARGPRTSDLDLVLVGDEASSLFAEDALLLGGLNTLPLSDEAPWVAPQLEPARRRAQAVARRPVSIQAMAGWFLELRAQVQGQPYVILAAPR